MKKSLILFCISCFSFIYSQELTTSIAIIGCHNQHAPAPVLPYLANEIEPEFTIWVGDNVYADTESNPEHIKNQLELMGGKEGFAELKEKSKFLVTWDDHDYGLNNSDKDYVFKEESKEIHRNFWELEDVVPENRDGIYNSYIAKLEQGKTIQFIMLDGRYNKDKPGKNADALGENQWTWLEEELQKPADIRFIASGYQVLLNKPTRWESWAKQGDSKRRLFDLITETKAKGVVFITGDQHYVEVLKDKKSLDYTAYEIMAAGINKTELPGLAGKRVAGPDRTVNSAPLITIHWNPTGLAPYIEFTVTDVTNKSLTLVYTIPLSDIGIE